MGSTTTGTIGKVCLKFGVYHSLCICIVVSQFPRDEAYQLMTRKYQSDSTIEDMPSRAKLVLSNHEYT